MFIILSTSPPKSACPGVSRILILTPLYSRAVVLAKIVIPRSFSRALESIDTLLTSSFSLNIPEVFKISSTKVVLP